MNTMFGRRAMTFGEAVCDEEHEVTDPPRQRTSRIHVS